MTMPCRLLTFLMRMTALLLGLRRLEVPGALATTMLLGSSAENDETVVTRLGTLRTRPVAALDVTGILLLPSAKETPVLP